MARLLMRLVLTFLSDFGAQMPYPAAMKAVAASITDARFIDISHAVRPQNIREGAFLLRSAVPFFPEGTVHCAVVDPGVGTERKGLIISAGGQYLVGPDNGLLIPAARRLGQLVVYQIDAERAGMRRAAPTFHGRDLFTPVAARLANGASPDQLGQPIEEWVDLDFGSGQLSADRWRLSGSVIYVDHFGNLITNISGELAKEFACIGDQLHLELPEGRVESLTLQPSYGFVRRGEALAYIGSGGTLELAMNGGCAAERFRLDVDSVIQLRRVQ